VGAKETASATPATTNQLMTKNIINYSNDSLSISSVVSGTTPANSQAIPVSPKTSTASNKISLVPTKLLLKSQAVNSFKQNPTIVYSSVQSTTTPGTITTNAQSSIPMKVVFVNALNNNTNAQQNMQKSQQITLNNKSIAQLQQSQNTSFLTNKLISTSQGQKVQIVQSQSHFNSVPKVTTTVNSSEQSSKINNRQSLGTKSPSKDFMIALSAETKFLCSLCSY
jgi:hypothetical protein